MKIAYRRMSGAIGLTDQEKGTRGLWWEKRKALFQCLYERGHRVDVAGRFTKPSQEFHETKVLDSSHEMLMIEFGSSNKSFYGDDLDETLAVAHRFRGPIVFLCDDPDLPYLWKTALPLPKQTWSAWYNCTRPQAFAGQPKWVKSFDFPFSSFQPTNSPSAEYQKDHLVYIGRPNGREKVVKALIAGGVPWRAFGKTEEWSALGVRVWDAPQQPDRAEFYRRQLGSLVLADSKHKRLGWRTGRAYHALFAGCPAVVEADHDALAGFTRFNTATDLRHLAERWKDLSERSRDWRAQMLSVEADRQIAEATLKAHGL